MTQFTCAVYLYRAEFTRKAIPHDNPLGKTSFEIIGASGAVEEPIYSQNSSVDTK